VNTDDPGSGVTLDDQDNLIGNEGTAITLGSTVSDPAQGNDTLTYTWSDTKNGQTIDTSNIDTSSTNFIFTPDDNATYVVTLNVTDEDGGTTTQTKTIFVNNVDPTVAIDVNTDDPDSGVTLDDQDNLIGNEGTAITLGSTVSDPAGSNDTLTYTWS